jgi:tRNA 2-selenouridine synthase
MGRVVRDTSVVTVAQLGEFDEIIDVRSPAEFADDHIPGASSCPVLDDEERARVGTIYKQASAFDAKKIGAALVSRNIARHIEQRFFDRPRQWHPLVYCWRGGQRSGAMAQVLSQIGWDTARLDGGYKAYRREVIAALETLPAQLDWRCICGKTGTGKSRLLAALVELGAQVLDLEQLARHRGSVLGGYSEPQPSQRMFESALWSRLRAFDRARPVFVESESSKIGAVRVPQALLTAMWQSPCIVLEAEVATRVALLMQEYAHLRADSTLLAAKLDALTSLHGKPAIARWQAMANPHEIEELVAQLLLTHYDPAYSRSIRKHYARLDQAQTLAVREADAGGMLELAQRILVPTR